MRRMILLANAFPFGTWEPFLETETKFYRDFKSVDIFSLSVRPDQFARKRELDNENCRTHAVALRSPMIYILYMIRVLLDVNFYTEFCGLVASKRVSVARLVQLMAFLSRCHYEAAVIRRILRSLFPPDPEDIVVIYAYRFSYQPYLAELIAKLFPSTVIVARAHGSDLYENTASNEYIPLRERTIELADEIHLISEHGYAYLMDRYPKARAKYRVSKLGTADHGAGPREKDGVLRLVSCSSIVPVKRLHVLAKALATIDEVRVCWTHFGDGPLREQLLALAGQLPQNVELRFLGEVDNSNVVRHYESEHFDFIVNVSESEGIPVSMMEASSFGIPILGVRVGGVPEIVHDGVNGMTIALESAGPEGVAELITWAAGLDQDEYYGLRNGARAVWQGNFRADVNYSEFIAELSRCAPKKPIGGA